MRVDLLVLIRTFVNEFLRNEFPRFFILIRTFVIIEAHIQRHTLDLLLKQITLIKEQDHRALIEPSRIADFFKEIQGFNNTISGGILVQDLIVFTDRSHENHSSNILEAMNPFLALIPLTANIEDFELNFLNRE